MKCLNATEHLVIIQKCVTNYPLSVARWWLMLSRFPVNENHTERNTGNRKFESVYVLRSSQCHCHLLARRYCTAVGRLSLLPFVGWIVKWVSDTPLSNHNKWRWCGRLARCERGPAVAFALRLHYLSNEPSELCQDDSPVNSRFHY